MGGLRVTGKSGTEVKAVINVMEAVMNVTEAVINVMEAVINVTEAVINVMKAEINVMDAPGSTPRAHGAERALRAPRTQGGTGASRPVRTGRNGRVAPRAHGAEQAPAPVTAVPPAGGAHAPERGGGG